MSDRCPWWETYREDQWAAVWSALEDHAAEQVEAAERHELPVPGRDRVYAPPKLRRPLSASAMVAQTRREIRAGVHEGPRRNRGLFETVRRIFDGVLLREYLEVLPEEEWVRLQKRLFIRAARFLGSRAGFEEVEDLVQRVVFQASTGERPWPRRGGDLVPLYPFFVWAMRSELSNQAKRKSSGQPTFGSVEDLDRLSQTAENAQLASGAGEVLVRDLVGKMLDTLAGPHREAIEGLLRRDTPREIHERLGVPLSTVHRWIRDFRHELRAALSAHPPVEKKKEL